MSQLTLVSLLKRVCAYYPDFARLSTRRLTNTIYLLDWRSSLVRSSQITDIHWRLETLGPSTPEIIEVLEDNQSTFRLHHYRTLFGDDRTSVELIEPLSEKDFFDEEVEELIEFIVPTTSHLEWGQFLDLVYLTYPISISPCEANMECDLNLVQLADQRSASLAYG